MEGGGRLGEIFRGRREGGSERSVGWASAKGALGGGLRQAAAAEGGRGALRRGSTERRGEMGKEKENCRRRSVSSDY